ncbi:FAD-binding oxidoreductase [Streptomyces sp. me109]|uniref:FAD-dependent oxidoreductase n=1 Tax=Streptomyces sp. me109 TaxID=1827853 RepID=UPI0011CE812A|nr:FAD-dependent oxidoreductase [Streptomyces sp. me109]TXS80619.1 FAD-binding oxidoreductase [Streptomyces sp. me109]
MAYHDVGIVGGGCAGLFLARELAVRGCDCIVIEKDPAAAHASTRNQGWLQSGSFYAAVDDAAAARGCREGFDYITETYPDAILREVESYFLFRSQQGLTGTLERCRREGIPINAIGGKEIRKIQDENPILHGTPLDYMAQVYDRPFDTRHLLQTVADEVASCRVEPMEIASLDSITASPKNHEWIVNVGNRSGIGCRILVLACGAYIPELLERITPEIPLAVEITKTPVLVLQGHQICRYAIMMPLEPGGLNLVPFKPIEDVAGVSVCLSRTDYPIDRAGNDFLPPKTPEAFAASLEAHLPGIREVVQASSRRVEAHFYTCQKLKEKLNGSSRGPLAQYYEDWRLGVFYPGKFTSSPIAASRFADDLCKQFGKKTVAGSGGEPLRVARQRYYDQADHRVEVTGGGVRFQLGRGVAE